ncbi:MAG: carbamoyl-phosphate synthase (glutamine-hydrolyzing) large subunit [Sporolactobacillus sp.]
MPLRSDIKKVLVIGSGPIVIGQAAEFDYAGTQACLALKEEGVEVVLINNNPATIMTDGPIADRTYIEPLNAETVEKVIAKERPDGLIGTLGGQTGLNLATHLFETGVLQKYGVEMLGTSVDSIKDGEDRERFKQLMLAIGEPIPESKTVHTYAEGATFVRSIGYPVIVRPAFTLGGSGGGFAYCEADLELVLHRGLALSPISEVLIEKSIKGWKEIEYEVMRDANDTCIIVCNMENVDPVGIHTGDSIVVAPSQTLSDRQYQMLRSASLKIIRALKIVGGCNIQFALNPQSDDYMIIEVNPRVSRSSALASKATGYPIARMAAKCALGYYLDEVLNPITGTTYASFEPAIDYIVVKMPRFPFDKFSEADHTLGTQMKATGEVMAIERTFAGALNKAARSLELGFSGVDNPAFHEVSTDVLNAQLARATDLRLFAVAELLRRGISVQSLHESTQIDDWFLSELADLIRLEQDIRVNGLTADALALAKRMNISDEHLAELSGSDLAAIQNRRREAGLHPSYHLVDTCAGEFEAQTPYYYSTWDGRDEAATDARPKLLIVGSGPIRIGQGIEFDYCSVQATLAVKKCGFQAIVINNNPETVSTDYSIADRLYFEPLTVEDILNVAEKEHVKGALVQFGGQTAVNVAEALQAAGITVLGSSTAAINALEDREAFYKLLAELAIPHIRGVSIDRLEDLPAAAETIGYPLLVRPSFVIGGQSMFLFHQAQQLHDYMVSDRHLNDRSFPLLVDHYVPGTECEIDAISDGEHVCIPGVFQHIERAGVHSGDSLAVFPSFSLSDAVKAEIAADTEKICRRLNIRGLINIQFVVSEGTVYVLEVNPRASRTVPIVSKVTGIAMVEKAVQIQLGQPVALVDGYAAAPHFYAVKAPVFSFSKLKDVDPILGPEMKSTGEVLGLALEVQPALAKACFFARANPFAAGETGTVLCSVAERQRADSLPLIAEMQRRGFQIVATPGTADYLLKNGIAARPMEEVEADRLFAADPPLALFNLPTAGRDSRSFGFRLRALALRCRVPIYSCADTLRAVLQADTAKAWAEDVLTINDYRSAAYSLGREKG